MLCRLVTLLLLLSLLLPVGAADAAAGAADGQKQVLLVLINRLTVAEAARMPEWQSLAAQGAAGLMNTNTAGKPASDSGYATLALGVPAALEEGELVVRNADEPAFDLPLSQVPQGETAVWIPSMQKLLQGEDLRRYAASYGSFGEKLRERGLKAAVLGSGDRGREQRRPAALLTADRTGRTALGDVGGRLLAPDAARPYGIRTNYQALWRTYEELAPQAAFVVLDLGDLDRLEAYKENLRPERYQELEKQTLGEIDRFLKIAAGRAGPDVLVIAAVPSAGDEERLAPLLMAGGGTQPGTVLTSATTRRAGLISNVDILPTAARHLGLPPVPGLIGYPMQGSDALAPSKLAALHERTIGTYEQRPYVLTLVGSVTGAALLLALVRLAFAAPLPPALPKRMLFLALGLPFALLAAPLFEPQGPLHWLGSVTALLLLLLLPFRRLLRSLTARLFWIGGWTVAAVVGDAFAGGPWAQASFLSYDPVVGARFYGVGNEYMGVAVGSAMMMFASLLLRRGSRTSALPFLALCLPLAAFFASPTLGTNTGGALTTAATAAFCAAGARGWRLWQTLLGVCASLLTACGLLFLLNQPSGAPSHIGMTAHLVLEGGADEMMRVLSRKSDMFVRLFTLTVWPSVLLALLVLFALFLTHPVTKGRWWYGRHLPYWRTTLGMLGGAGVGLFTNDSGVVVAAMILLFALFPVLLVLLEPEQAGVRASGTARPAAS